MLVAPVETSMTRTSDRRRCAACGQPVPPRRDARCCSARCRARLHRLRHTRELRDGLQDLRDTITKLEKLIDRTQR